MNHRKLPLNFFGKSDAEFQRFHEKHLFKVKDTRFIESQGKALLNQKHNPSFGQLRDFSKLVFSWGGRTGGRVRWRTLKVPSRDFRYAFLAALFYIRAKEFFLALLHTQTISGLRSLSYSSKHLRFFWPEYFGVLDSFVENHLKKTFPSLSSLHRLYLYCVYCQEKAAELSKRGLLLGDCLPTTPNYPVYSNAAKPWRAADVDMAVFAKLSFAAKRKGWYP